MGASIGVVEPARSNSGTPRLPRRLAGTVLRLAVVSAAIGLISRGIRWTDVRLGLMDVRPVLLFGVVGLNAAMMGIKAARLRLLLAPASTTWTPCFQALLTSSAINNVVPLRGGDIARLWMLERSAGVTKAAAAAASVIERLVDIGALALLAIGASLCRPSQRWAILAAPVVLAGTAGLLLALNRLASTPPWRPSYDDGGLRRPRWMTKLFGFRGRITGGTAVLQSASSLAAVVGFSLASWIVETLMVMTCGQALHLDIAAPIAIITLLGINLALALPSTPSNAGPFEASAVVVLTTAGFLKPTAIAFALTYHLVQVLPVTTIGLAVVAFEGDWRKRTLGTVMTTEDRFPGPIRAESDNHELGLRDVERL